MTGAVGWRKDNLRYKKNEVFLDIVEQVCPINSRAPGMPRSTLLLSSNRHSNTRATTQCSRSAGFVLEKKKEILRR